MKTKCLATILVCLALVPWMGQGCPDQPQVTDQIRQSCWWVGDDMLQEALDVGVLYREMGNTAQDFTDEFASSCVDGCLSTGNDEATCADNCDGCAAALAEEIW